MEKNSSQNSYFKIGIFVLFGFAIMVAGLLTFGSAKLFRPTIYIETYFDESVQGISVGSPVKYRGMQIGYVKTIAFASEVYPGSIDEKLHSRSIYIKIAITSKLFTSLSREDFSKLFNEEVESGLRVKLVSQGLTGMNYLELNYVDPVKTPPTTKISWEPQNFYIPSAPSAFLKFSDNLQLIFDKLKEIDFATITANLDKSLLSLNDASTKAAQLLDRDHDAFIAMMQNLKAASNNFRTLSEQLKLYPSQIIFGGMPKPIDPGKL